MFTNVNYVPCILLETVSVKFGFTKACAILDTMVGSMKMKIDEETKSEEVLLGKSKNLNGTNLKLMSQCVWKVCHLVTSTVTLLWYIICQLATKSPYLQL